MTTQQQHEALRLADICAKKGLFAVEDELRRLHAESELHMQELRSYRITVENREARIAELEKQLAEVTEWKRVAAAQAELHGEAEERADKLAKALKELITWIPSADTYRRLGFDPEAPMRAFKEARAALTKENSND